MTLEREIENFCKKNLVSVKEENVSIALELFNNSAKGRKELSSFLRSICFHSKDEIIECWDKQLRIKTFSNSLPNLIAYFGKEEGTRRYEVNREISKKRNTGFSNELRWEIKGLSPLEISERRRLIASKVAKARKENGTVGIGHTLPWCREYYTGFELPESEIEEMRLAALVGFHKLDEETYLDMVKRRTKTRINNPPDTSVVSKQSLSFFQELIELFPILADSKWGIGNERWLRDPDDFDKYYFYDFTNLNFNLIIEFDGATFHPRTETGEFNSFLKSSQKELYRKDIRKNIAARHFGFEILRYRTDFSKDEKTAFFSELKRKLYD